MDRAEIGFGHQAFGKGVANAAAERVDQVFFGMGVSREVDLLAAAALPAVSLESGFQPHAPRVDQKFPASSREAGSGQVRSRKQEAGQVRIGRLGSFTARRRQPLRPGTGTDSRRGGRGDRHS
jgi:hypothetical protein